MNDSDGKRHVKDTGLLSSKIDFFLQLPRVLIEFPRFLKQRQLLVKFPVFALTPPHDFEKWLSPKEFVARNLAYIGVLGLTLKLAENWMLPEDALVLRSYSLVSYGEFVVPTALLGVLLVLKGLMHVVLPHHKLAAISNDFQVVYCTYVLTVPFWAYVTIVVMIFIAGVAIAVIRQGEVYILAIFHVPTAAVIIAYLAWLFALISSFQAIADVCRVCQIKPNAFVAVGFVCFFIFALVMDLLLFWLAGQLFASH